MPKKTAKDPKETTLKNISEDNAKLDLLEKRIETANIRRAAGKRFSHSREPRDVFLKVKTEISNISRMQVMLFFVVIIMIISVSMLVYVNTEVDVDEFAEDNGIKDFLSERFGRSDDIKLLDALDGNESAENG